MGLKKNTDRQRFSYEFIKSEFEKVGYNLISNFYKNSSQLLQYRCPIHPDKELYVSYNNFRTGNRCPYCYQSKGEYKISTILTNKNIEYEIQKGFKGCVYKKPLKFDFYLQEYNLCIEYQGEGHYMPIDFAGKGKKWAEQSLLKNQKRDEIKRKFCKENNVYLLEIPYWDFDRIESILIEKIYKTQEEL